MLDKIEISTEGGQRLIVDEPPIMRHDETLSVDLAAMVMNAYLPTVRADVAILLSQFTLVDSVLRVRTGERDRDAV